MDLLELLLKESRVKHKGDKFIVTDESGKQVLGTHDNPKDAYGQLYAIEKSKERRAKKKKHSPKKHKRSSESFLISATEFLVRQVEK